MKADWKRKAGVSGPGKAYGYVAIYGGYLAQIWKVPKKGWWAVACSSADEDYWSRPTMMAHGWRTLAEAKAEAVRWLEIFGGR